MSSWLILKPEGLKAEIYRIWLRERTSTGRYIPESRGVSLAYSSRE
jgi:hypothetical protein